MTFLVAMNLLRNPAIWAAGALVAIVVAFGTGYLKGRADGANIAEGRVINSTLKQLEERGIINEAVRNTDDVALCIELGGLLDDCQR